MEGNKTLGAAFEDIRNLRDYLPAVNECLAGANLQMAQILNDLKKILKARDAIQLSKLLHDDISVATARQIDFVQGSQSTISVPRLIELLDKVAAEYARQHDMSKTDLIKLLKQQEELLLSQEQQKQNLEENINDILDFTQRIAFAAKDKARLTARTSKQRFDVANQTIQTILKRRRNERENPEPVDVDKLSRVYWQRPEEYYK